MDVHHFDPGVVRDEWDPAMEPSFNIDPPVLNVKTEIMMKRKLFAPIRTCFRLFVDLTTFVENVLAHSSLNVIR
jgi:hypothetical protein